MKAFSLLSHKVFIIIIRPESKKPRITSFQESGLDVTEIHPPYVGIKGKKGIGKYLKYLTCYPSVSKEASKIIKEHGIDYVYSYMPGIGSSAPAIRIKSKHKMKFILDLADMYNLIKPKIIVKSSFKNADKILTITEYLKNDLTHNGIDSKKIQIISNGVDLELFDPNRYDKNEIEKLRKSFDAEKIILFAGSLQDLNIIINSAKQVIHSIPSVKYLIIGDHRDPNRTSKSWESKVKEKKLEKNFIFLGRKPRQEIPKFLLCADVCVDSFPDEPYYAAAHPIKLLEYGACEKPVVATSVSETAKIVKHGKYGYLAKPSNSDSFEYSSTTRFSLMSGRMSSRSGNDLRVPAIFFASTSTQSGKPTWLAISNAFWMRSCFLALVLMPTASPAFT